jgi:hypothetical protein
MKKVPIIYVSIIQIRYEIYQLTAKLKLIDDFEISSFELFGVKFIYLLYKIQSTSTVPKSNRLTRLRTRHRRAGSYPTLPHPFQPCMRDCIPSTSFSVLSNLPPLGIPLVPMTRLHSFHPSRSSLIITSSFVIVVVVLIARYRPRRLSLEW